MLVLEDKKTLKVSILVSDLSSSGAGRWGGAVRSFLLAQALQKNKCKVEILGFDFSHETGTTYQSEIPVYKLNGHNYPQFIGEASQLLKMVDGDIIYAMRPKATTFGLSILKKMGSQRPVILDIDDWELSWYDDEKWQYRPSIKQLYRDVFKSNGALRQPDHPIYLKWMENMVNRADAITIHTQFLKSKFGGVYVPNGKDTNLFNPEKYNSEESRARYGLSGYRVLMFPGAPRPYKGVEDVLVALDKLNEPDLRLAIVGGSPYDNYDSQLLEKWGRWIIQLPKSSPTAMPEIVSAAHVIVVPQRNTPAALAQFPLKITDGMSMAKPILATRVGDIPEILGGTGYLVDPCSPEQIADKIQWIFNHLEEAQEQGKLAREQCIKYYSIDAMAAILSKLLQKL